jgi:N-acetylneuraminic acid mutarotase
MVEFGEWRTAASMIRARTGFDAVVLGDGSVLAVGDDFACYPGPAVPGSERAERYDPAKDGWGAIQSLNKPRKEPATVVLPDGSALVIGGVNDTEQAFSSTKLLAPGRGRWVDGPLMVVARDAPVAVTIPDGVFVVSETRGGFTSERLDPGADAWRTAASLPAGARVDDMVALGDGTVLALGSAANGSAEPTPAAYRYDPGRDAWSVVPGLHQGSPELVATADGGALAIGGLDGTTDAITARVHRFDSATGTWTEIAPMSTPRSRPQVVALDDGRVLVAGGAAGDGFADSRALASTELYDPSADRWLPESDLRAPRYGGHALALRDGSILVLGGANDFNTAGDTPWCPTPLATTERLNPTP